MDAADLQPERLYLFLLGPGYGESILVRIPPDRWVVVDSFRWTGSTGQVETSALKLLRKAGGRLEGVILTHPHDDHAPGLADLIQESPDAWVGCAEHWLVPSVGDGTDLERTLKQGTVAHTLAAIRTAWESTSRMWPLRAGEVKTVGASTFTVLYPDQKALDEVASASTNRLSSPVLLSWKGLRVLLGADLPGAQWGLIERHHQLHDHRLYKVAHHASRDSVNAEALGDVRDRIWMASPWNRNKKLPRFEDGHGVDQILGIVDRLWLTALPTLIGHPPPVEVTREQVRTATAGDPDLGVPVERLPRNSTSMDGWIRAEFNEAGELSDLRLGPLALAIVPPAERESMSSTP